MNVLLISEHYFPKIGGTVSYVENTAINLALKGVTVFLLIPAFGNIGELEEKYLPEKGITLLKIGVVDSSKLLFNQQERTHLCNWIKNNIVKLTQQYNISVVHLLYGLFIAEILDTKSLKNIGVKTIHTIHNIPPLECSNSWNGDKIYLYLKDELRKLGVKFINSYRIKKNEFEVYITPSNFVKSVLGTMVNPAKIHVIGHGGAEHIKSNGNQNNDATIISILTVGGIVPHKNQHLIPKLAAHLLKNNINFKWDIVGPIRNKRYFNVLKNDINRYSLAETVYIHENVDVNTLNSFYNNASLYVQLSSEEGFCMTVLDAISHNIPVLATPVGAIPEMLEKVEGTIVENNLSSLKSIITHYLKIRTHLKIKEDLLINFKKEYTWSNAVDRLLKQYHD